MQTRFLMILTCSLFAITTFNIILLSSCLADTTNQDTTSQDLSASKQREVMAKEAIQKDPNSEAAHLQLASVYMDQKREAEAQKELDHVLKLNPQNSAALLLKRILKIDSSDKPQTEKIKALLGEVSESAKEFSSLSDALDLDKIKQAREQRKVQLDQQYAISTFSFPKDARPVFSEQHKLIMDLRMKGDQDELGKALKADFDNYPNSIDARIDYADFLLKRGNEVEAEALINEALKSHPKHPYLLIMQAGIKEAQKAVSTEAKDKARTDLMMRMLDARMIKSDQLMKNLGN